MAASSVAEAFNWTPFSHGFVFWESPKPEHGPPSNQAGQWDWLEGFLQAHADYPDEPYDRDKPGQRRDGSGRAAADATRQPATASASGAPQVLT